MKSFLWSIVFRSSLVFVIVTILILVSFIGVDAWNLRSSIDQEITNSFAVTIPGIRQNLMLGDYNSVRNGLDVWAKDQNISGTMTDNSGNPIWKISNASSPFQISKSIAVGFDENAKLAELIVFKNYKPEILNHLFKYLKYSVMFLLIGVVLVSIFGYVLYTSLFPIRRLRDQLSNEFKVLGLDITTTNVNELEEIQVRFSDLTSAWQIEKERTREMGRLQALGEVAAQVSHDIRSPLSALNMIMSQLAQIPEEQRILIRSSVNRINDIANSLLAKSNKSQASAQTSIDLENIMLASLVDSLVSEKRIQLREHPEVELSADLQNSYGLFAKLNSAELKRCLSNLINNSSEALRCRGGVIEVSLSGNGDWIELSVRDNGMGIPKHILEKLGQIGVTHGKDGTQSGSGLGVYHAKKTVESFGGVFEVQSQQGKGTTITIKLKSEPAPDWFVRTLELKQGQTVVALDDDSSILEIWRQRLLPHIKSNEIKLVTCSTGTCLRDWLATNGDISSTSIFLIDYEFLGQRQNGLDLIEILDLSNRSILVSSRFEEKFVKARSAQMGVKLIPKGMASLVPIEIGPPARQAAPATKPALRKPDAIILDDEPLQKMMWQMVASEKAKQIEFFETPSELMANLDTYDKAVSIYVDSNLGHGVKGENVTLQLYQLGFTSLYLATGYPASNFAHLTFLRGVVGKDPVL